MIVHSPKTEGKGKDKRIVPIFAPLYPYLREAFDNALKGVETPDDFEMFFEMFFEMLLPDRRVKSAKSSMNVFSTLAAKVKSDVREEFLVKTRVANTVDEFVKG